MMGNGLSTTYVAQLSRWLDVFQTVPAEEREAWFALLPQVKEAQLCNMGTLLDRIEQAGNSSLLLTLPRLEAPAADSAHAGDLVGPYRLLHPLGRGGMAAVWLAERADGEMKRHLAIKLPIQTLSTQQQFARFAWERDVLATLEHPHIARLYDAGVSPEGQPFLVLEYVDGVSLTQHCANKCLSVVERVRLFLQVLDAVDYAHNQAIVHRDLKPSNILVDRVGQVKLLDFGVAKVLRDADAGQFSVVATQVGRQAMTPLYAAPEQIQAAGHPISASADIFALGVVLFELLTGEWPFANHVRKRKHDLRVAIDLMHAVLHGEPTRLSAVDISEDTARRCGGISVRRLRAILRGDIGTIVLKALRHQPNERYQSASELAEELRRYTANLPIAAREPSIFYRMRLTMRRHRGAIVGATTGVMAAAILGGVAWQKQTEASEYQERAVIIRNFMLEVINDAEPDERQSNSPVTAMQLVDGAVKRARGLYSDNPRLKGELLSELGYRYLHLGDPGAARKLTAEALVLLEANAPAHDPALNMARAREAVTLVLQEDRGKWEYGRALALRAMDHCQHDGEECAKVRYFALNALAIADGKLGYFGQTLINSRKALEQARLGFGAGHDETVQALLSLAVSARNAGHCREAQRALDELLFTTSHRVLRASVRSGIQTLQAKLDVDLGRYTIARDELNELISVDSSLGRAPVSAGWYVQARSQLALKYGYLAEAKLALGDPLGAKQSAEASLNMPGADLSSGDMLAIRSALVQAESLLGNTEKAIEDAKALLAEQPPTDGNSITTLRVRMIHGELLARAGRLTEARQELDVVAEQASLMQPDIHPVLLARANDQLGSVLRALRQPELAISRHERAGTLLRQVLPDDHPWLARNALYLAAAKMDLAAGQDQEHLLEQAEQYKSYYPPVSVWRDVVDRHLRNSQSPVLANTACPSCILLL